MRRFLIENFSQGERLDNKIVNEPSSDAAFEKYQYDEGITKIKEVPEASEIVDESKESTD